MATPASEARIFAQPWMESLASQGYGRTQIVDILREAGISYRYQDMLADARAYQGAFIKATELQKLSPSQMIPVELASDSPKLLRRTYMADFIINVRDPETGVPTQLERSLSTSWLRSPQALEDRMTEILEQDPENSPIEILNVNLTVVWHRSTAGHQWIADEAPWD